MERETKITNPDSLIRFDDFHSFRLIELWEKAENPNAVELEKKVQKKLE